MDSGRMLDPCPCGSGSSYAECCGPLHDGAAALTAGALMRARFSAFAIGDSDYLVRSWHPRTRPERVRLDPDITWLSLQIVDAGDKHIEFIARFRGPNGRGFLRERSRFARHGDRWYYLDGTTE